MASKDDQDGGGDGGQGSRATRISMCTHVQREHEEDPAVPWPPETCEDHDHDFVTARSVLMETRGMSAVVASQVLRTKKCEECQCRLDLEHDQECCCPCHCDCCCPPFFRCTFECKCDCNCHYDPSQSDEEGEGDDQDSNTNDETVAETPASGTSTNGGALDGSVTAVPTVNGDENHGMDTSEESESSGDEDERAPPATAGGGKADPPEPKGEDAEDAVLHASPNGDGDAEVQLAQESNPISAENGSDKRAPITPSALFQELVEVTQRVDDEAVEYGSRLLAELFELAYREAIKPGMTKKKKTDLPATTDEERTLLMSYGCVLILDQKLGFPRVWGALRDLAVASTRSVWSFAKILQDRTVLAKAPRAPPANVWTQRTQPSTTTQGGPPSAQERFVFNVDHYTTDEIERYRAICEQPHVFPETTRQPSPEEWEIMTGIMEGKILARVMPQFLKRCCQMRQFTWFHQEMILRAEGELWTPLPVLSKMYNYNQSSRRIIAEIRQSAVHQQWTDARLTDMLANVKAASYDKARHALHFHFFTKEIAAQWEGLQVPFRTSKLALRNPDTTTTANAQGATVNAAPANDGLTNDRYQAHYKIRLSNVPRTLAIDQVAAYLQELTNDGLKIGVPLDSYGQHSDWSLLWDFYGKTASCPPALADIHRIMWGDHAIMVQHRPSSGYAACLSCARLGHQMAACTTPEPERMGKTTLIVPANSIAKYTHARKAWSSTADALALFQALGQPSSGGAGADEVREGAVSEPTPPTEVDKAGTDVNPGQAVDAPIAAGPPKQAEPETPWATAGKKRKGRKKSKKSSEKPANKASSSVARTFRRGTDVAAGGIVDLTGDADSDTDDGEDEEMKTDEEDHGDQRGQAKPATSGSKSSKAVPKNKGKASKYADDNEEKALRRAINRKRLEAFQATFLEHVDLTEQIYAPAELQAAIDMALPHVQEKSSRDWIFKAINGRAAATPGTGNCQYVASTEALYQQEIRGPAKQTIEETTMLVKYGLWLASAVVADEEILLCNMSDILATPPGSPVVESAKERDARITKHFQDLATSDSAANAKLPRALWGGFDTLRMLTMLVNRPIYLISEHKGRHDVFLNVIQLQRDKYGTTKAVMTRPGTTAWLKMLREESTSNNRAPIVLHYHDDHYDAVLLDAHDPQVLPVPTKRQTKLTDLVPALPTVDELIAKNKQTARWGVTRKEVLAADASITNEDMTDFLTNPNWSIVEKREIIGVLVSGATNYREVLTFSVAASSDEAGTSDDDCEPAPPASPSDSDFSPDSENEEMESQGSSQAFSLPSQENQEYREWADEMWESVRSEWKTQHNQDLPELTDQVALRKLAVAEPALVCELGRWFDNPFVFLDHFRSDTIKDWMEPNRQAYLLKCLTAIGADVKDAKAHAYLHQWISDARACDDRVSRRAQLRNETAWGLLKMHATETMKGPEALPFLTRDYSTKCAYILVLDELFPTLGRTVVTSEGHTVPSQTLPLTEAYRQSAALRSALDAAIADKSWQPLAEYMNSLPQPSTGAAGSQY